MKFLPTIDLWATGIQQALTTGALKLQRGQWVRCGNGKPSRFVRATSTSIWAVHYCPDQNKKFMGICESFKKSAIRMENRNKLRG